MYEWDRQVIVDLIVSATSPPTPDRRVAIVTGANHGIGAATAVALATAGVDVLVTYLRAPASGDQPVEYDLQRAADAADVLAAIEPLPGRAVAMEADLTDDDVADLLFDEAEARLGPVSILVNNASGWVADTFTPDAVDRLGRPLTAVSPVTVDRNLGVDARAGALLLAELARRHVARGARWGRVVGLTSGGPMGFPQEVSYGAAKAALENYTMAASSELAPYGITANIVHPPVTDTGWITDEVRQAVRDSTELHHVATPAEVADVIVWLCSDAARLVTGSRIHLR
ncbi:MAG: SDR family oxidoreductase [Ilumatobacteraceae bacterium]